MPRMIFHWPYHWHPSPPVTVSFKAGIEYGVTQKCADEALAAGAGVLVERQASKPRVGKTQEATRDDAIG